MTSVAAGLSNPAAAALGIRRCDRPPVHSACRNDQIAMFLSYQELDTFLIGFFLLFFHPEDQSVCIPC
jgi:hypothetical protein